MQKQRISAAEESSRLTEYLLDRLPDAEARQIEERYFADDEFFVLAGACEQELIRGYLRKELPAQDARTFERKYLGSPGLREKVETCAALMALAGAPPVAERARAGFEAPYWRWAAAAAMLAGLSLLSWQQLRISGLEARLSAGFGSNAAMVAKNRRAADIPSFALTAALDRDSHSAPTVLRVPAVAEEVKLSAEIEPGNEASRYQAAVVLPEGTEVWSAFVAGGDRLVVITIPAHLMPRGDYVLTLDGGGRAHEAYSFRVERE